MVGFRVFVVFAAVRVDRLAAVTVDLVAFELTWDLVVVDLDADLLAVDFVVLRGDGFEVVFRVDEAALFVRFAVVALFLLAGEDLRDDVRRVVVAALDLEVGDFDGVDFFRADDVLVVFVVVVFRFVVVAFLVAISSLPAK